VKKVSASQLKHFPSCLPLAGVEELLQALSRRTSPAVEIALATSSHSANFKLKTNHLAELFSVFSQEHRVLGDDPRIPKGRGKPAPDIYLLALETINERLRKGQQPEIKPEECLVFEDSVPGVESGRRAGMQVVWCPHPGLLNEYRGREDEVLAGLTGEYKDVPLAPAPQSTASIIQKTPGAGATGKIGDGYARLIPTLENFPYESYGIRVQDQSGKRSSHV
jgi:pseudouridine-5'-monophosphatase